MGGNISSRSKQRETPTHRRRHKALPHSLPPHPSLRPPARLRVWSQQRKHAKNLARARTRGRNCERNAHSTAAYARPRPPGPRRHPPFLLIPPCGFVSCAAGRGPTQRRPVWSSSCSAGTGNNQRRALEQALSVVVVALCANMLLNALIVATHTHTHENTHTNTHTTRIHPHEYTHTHTHVAECACSRRRMMAAGMYSSYHRHPAAHIRWASSYRDCGVCEVRDLDKHKAFWRLEVCFERHTCAMGGGSLSVARCLAPNTEHTRSERETHSTSPSPRLMKASSFSA